MDLALNHITNDLDIKALDLYLVNEDESVRQQLYIKLNLWRGEWFLDTEFGTPYLEEVLGKRISLNGAVAAIRRSILEVDDVIRITTFVYKFDRATRKLNINFEVLTPYGTIEVDDVAI